MKHLLLIFGIVLGACVSPTLTHCPDLDCPKNEVCDGQGGCAFPQQLSACDGFTTGDPCTYPDPTGATVMGECVNMVCLPIGCGNGVVTPDEERDDGNNVAGDGCSADCKSNEPCGNGVIDTQVGEQCDDSNAVDGDGCQHDCQLPRCGDGVIDTQVGETCDSGAANSLAPDAPCRPDCQL